jgi:sulfate transport system ATP-binding protein
LELVAIESDGPSDGNIMEAHMPASQYRDQGLKEGETLLLTPRKARVFVAS